MRRGQSACQVLRCLSTVVCLLSLADANGRRAGAGMASAAVSRLHWAWVLLPLHVQAGFDQSWLFPGAGTCYFVKALSGCR